MSAVASVHPILFSAPMIRAILAGTKTQTRRAVKPQPPSRTKLVLSLLQPDLRHRFIAFDRQGRRGPLDEVSEWPPILCPFGQKGDQLWVRETWAAPHNCDHLKPSEIDSDWRIHYAATEERGGLLWRPSIHMPRWMSRITLQITNVRVERLQDISEADAMAEGMSVSTNRYATENYTELWDQINSPGSWDANPWVWRIGFDVSWCSVSVAT